MDKTIKISRWTAEQLDKLKQKQGHTSYDSVIKSLIIRAEKAA